VRYARQALTAHARVTLRGVEEIELHTEGGKMMVYREAIIHKMRHMELFAKSGFHKPLRAVDHVVSLHSGETIKITEGEPVVCFFLKLSADF
jgi:hypothetical protein